MNNTYPYPYSAAEARKRNELSLWRESHKANIACRNAIEKAIRQNFDGMHLDKNCITPVLDTFKHTATHTQHHCIFIKLRKNSHHLSIRLFHWAVIAYTVMDTLELYAVWLEYLLNHI